MDAAIALSLSFSQRQHLHQRTGCRSVMRPDTDSQPADTLEGWH